MVAVATLLTVVSSCTQSSFQLTFKLKFCANCPFIQWLIFHFVSGNVSGLSVSSRVSRASEMNSAQRWSSSGSLVVPMVPEVSRKTANLGNPRQLGSKTRAAETKSPKIPSVCHIDLSGSVTISSVPSQCVLSTFSAKKTVLAF